MAMTMEELLASQKQTRINVYRGKEVSGEIVGITPKEITLDLGAKSEGVIQARDFPRDQLKDLKTGDKITAFVYQSENESGQIALSLTPRQERVGFRGKNGISFSRFLTAQHNKARLKGKITEVNKGGFIVEVEGVRGFLPNSQIGFELLSKLNKNSPDPAGVEITVFVSEIDEENNRLIFTQRDLLKEDQLNLLRQFKKDQELEGWVIAILPFALVVNFNNFNGLIFIQDVSWDRTEDLSGVFKSGQKVEAMVLGIDENFGRLNLSIKHLLEDPFIKILEDYPADEVVKAEISSISEGGLFLKLADGVDGFLPSSKFDPGASYEAGKSMTFLVDSVDTHKRRVNLAPFITSTAGLIYK